MLATLTNPAEQHTSELVLRIAFGFAIYFGIQKVFKDLDEKLSEDTRLRIAVWLLDAKIEHLIEPWPRTFARVFDQAFGKHHFSWQCFKRSCLASLIAVMAVALYVGARILIGGHTTRDPIIGLFLKLVGYLFLLVVSFF
jgi:hypothetical protein